MGQLNLCLVVLAGGVGSVVGATINYFVLGRWIGKPFLEKYGKYILITREKYNRSEALFPRNNKLYTFIGRLFPVVRHLISIPVGIFCMPLTPFWILTFLGATLWCTVLVVFGYIF